jgi:hypothetical protein
MKSSVAAAAVNEFLAQGGKRENAFILTWANWIDWRLLSIQTGDPKWRSLADGLKPVRLQDGVPQARLVLTHPEDNVALDTLRRWYPQATHRVWLTNGETGTPWVTAVRIPPGAIAGVAPASIAAPDSW